jgi:DNA-directed RNA polymerase specialized sigma subunit
MIEYLEDCSKIIKCFANDFHNQYGRLEVDELVSEGWVCAVEAYNNWNPNGGSKYTTYLFTRLKWLKNNILDKHIKRKLAEERFSESYSLIYEDHHVIDVYDELINKLDYNELEIFKLHVVPSASFKKFMEDKRNTKIVSSYYAKFLGVSLMKVSRTLLKIRKVFE